ncbi:leucyl aminopeptidase [Dongia soli]|uniref:Probable cytosol aminopeptidase n=1 Tax=Dongia soli TaxID=600628 RepID=A0ABU5ECW4_9PROT|nr:leucyl aminopeptidase [Dongia soli]MDY0884021.1 leucyl aminopeptidase [Dongia soli]
MKIAFAKPELPAQGTLVAVVAEQRKLGQLATQIDKSGKGAVTRALGASRFKGNADELLTILAPAGIEADRLVLAGLGNPEKLDNLVAQAIGGRIVAASNGVGEKEVTIQVESPAGSPLSEAALAAQIAYGANLRAYRFDKYKTKEKPEQKPSVKKLTILTSDPAAAKKLYEPLDKIAEAVNFSRDLVSEPGNVIYPASLAEQARSLKALGVEVEVLGEAAMKKLGMGALLGVGQGSDRESQLVVMRWNGAKNSKQPVAFIGKGVTFDTGGISLKPGAGMEDMKWDMGGSAAVIGAMRALAARKAKANVVGVVGLVENMPDGKAQRPGDIVTSMSGQTIEVLNTDAEGRLVLADAMWYAQENFKPHTMIDLATLTGAILIALGNHQAGMFSNDDKLAEQLSAAGKATGELLWRMPLAPAYDRLMDSPAADMKNISGSRNAGSVTAAQFLQRFVQKGVNWAHLDIAGMAWGDKDQPTCPKGATAFGVRLLDNLIATNFEEK